MKIFGLTIRRTKTVVAEREKFHQDVQDAYAVGLNDGIVTVVVDALPDGWFFKERNVFYTGVGQRLATIHGEGPDCHERGCVLHNPSKHHLRHMKTSWRGDRYLMERICEHGVGHPDPDDQAYKKLNWEPSRAAADAVHGCDGCCAKPERKPRRKPAAKKPAPKKPAAKKAAPKRGGAKRGRKNAS